MGKLGIERSEDQAFRGLAFLALRAGFLLLRLLGDRRPLT